MRFDYTKTDYRFVAKYENGKWNEGELVTDEYLKIHEGSTALHYGQEAFEGLKAYTTQTGKIVLFRPDMNSKRLNKSCDYLLMPQIPETMFINAVKKVVKANEKFVPPYGSGASLYIRPYIFGVGPNVGVKPASQYIFSIFVTPVGPYF